MLLSLDKKASRSVAGRLTEKKLRQLLPNESDDEIDNSTVVKAAEEDNSGSTKSFGDVRLQSTDIC